MIRSRTWISFRDRPRDACAALAFAIALACPAAARGADREIPAPAVRAWQTGLARPDRLQHATLALTLGLGAGLASREPWAAAAIPAALGLIKEISDRPKFDRIDLLADLAGAAAAGWATSRWRR